MIRQNKQLDAQIFFKTIWAGNRIHSYFAFLFRQNHMSSGRDFFSTKIKKIQSTNWLVHRALSQNPARKQAGPARSPPPS
jgi:hypothetical protein